MRNEFVFFKQKLIQSGVNTNFSTAFKYYAKIYINSALRRMLP